MSRKGSKELEAHRGGEYAKSSILIFDKVCQLFPPATSQAQDHITPTAGSYDCLPVMPLAII